MTTWLEPQGGTAERMGERFRQCLAGGGIVRAPGAHDAMAGLIARDAGFDVLYVSGAAVTALVARVRSSIPVGPPSRNTSSPRW